MKELVSIFGKRYRENDRGRRNWIAMKARRSNPTGARYLSEYLKEYHGVDVQPPTAEVYDGPDPKEGSPIAVAMAGLDSETDVDLLRRKGVRLARALSDAEEERDSLRARLAKLESVLSNVDNVITSDLDSASDKEKKLELLKVVFEENRELREALDNE